ncbi:Hsp33 family molecular chaperone [Anoxybacter fermentans]|uniref:33 kDa chaperonin n=1 Tax=Anoxybacter fermentans TaxID=1323375 RepID=A0A3S9SY84_9FIRM|nr:Hsp33 family molecular chaperone HslO [Anoxybacter fermentans]AZR73269.1 Hsp33 family molecular chaperone [Anoxybacter fermentans]
MENIILRASGEKGQVRVFVGVTTELVEEARRRHNTSPLATAALGRVLTAGALMGAMLKEGQEVSLQFIGDGPLGAIFVIADSKGNVRGYVRHPEVELDLNDKGKLDVAKGLGKGMLYVLKDLGLKEPYKGSVPFVSGEIGEDLTYYFTKSEQTPSAVGLGVLINPDLTVKAAGGFILQLLPHAEEEVIQKLENNLKKFSNGVTPLIDAGKGPEELLALLLEGIEYKITERRNVRFKCKCNRERLERVVINLGEDEARDILEKENKLELTCHFCNEKYVFGEEDVDKLFAENKD